LALVAASSAGPSVALAQREAEGLSASFRKAADRVAPAVVGIRPLDVLAPMFPPGPGGLLPGMPIRPVEVARASGGSGLVADAARGLILTCEQVIEGASRVAIILSDGREVVTERIARDPRTGLVVLSIDPKSAALQQVEWGEGDAPQEADWVVSVGRANGRTRSLSAGIVSGVGAGGRGEADILIGAVIPAGNWGGPVVNLDGKLVGIALPRVDPRGRIDGFGHAVAASIARKVAGDLADLGRVRRAYLGLRIEREETADPRQGGGRLYVAGVMPGSPAAEAGIQMGDRIEALDGRPVADVESFSQAVMDAPVGQEFAVTIERGGVSKEIRVKSRQLPGPANVPAASRPVRPGAARRVPQRERPKAEWQRPAAPRQKAPLRSEPSDVQPPRPPGAGSSDPGPRPDAKKSQGVPEAAVAPAPALSPALDPAADRSPATVPRLENQ
jgi:S1-C subfamily serine protease